MPARSVASPRIDADRRPTASYPDGPVDHDVPVLAARTDGTLRAVFKDQPVAFQGPPDRDELERMAASDDPADRKCGRALLNELDETGSIATEYPYPVQALGFGTDLTLIRLGGEVLVEYGLQLKESLPGRVWIAGYANTDFTYPHDASDLRGRLRKSPGHPVHDLPGPLEPDVEDRILGAARAAAKRVSGPVDDAGANPVDDSGASPAE